MVQAVFWIAAAISLLGGLGVIISRQPIRSILNLVAVMLALSVLFLLLSAQFLFAVQVIVYAGAVMVLFLFVVALLGPVREMGFGRLRFHWAFSLLVAVPFFGVLWATLTAVRFRAPQGGDLSTFGSVQQIGLGLFTSYLFPFELTSILLLVAAVGAIYLSRGARPGVDPDSATEAGSQEPEVPQIGTPEAAEVHAAGEKEESRA